MEMAAAQTARRFDEAIEKARQLPPTLLSKDQKLKLFALFKQADGLAPVEPPAKASPLEMEKVPRARHPRRAASGSRALQPRPR